jgi:hypothetical protein
MKKISYFLFVFFILSAFSGCNLNEDGLVPGTLNPLSVTSSVLTNEFCGPDVYYSSYTNYTNSPSGFTSVGYVDMVNNETLIFLYLSSSIGFYNLPDNIDIGFYTASLPSSKPDPSGMHYHYTTGSTVITSYGIELPIGNIFIENLGSFSSLKCGEPVYILIHYDALDAMGNPVDVWSGNYGYMSENDWWFKYIAYTPACCVTCSSETAWGGNTAGPDRRAWWKYFRVSNGLTQNIYAGQNVNIGTVTFNPINRTLDIKLTDGWVLDIIDENADGISDNNTIKIQGYNILPSVRPAPGLFTTYKGNNLTDIHVASYSYFAIHLDVKICK